MSLMNLKYSYETRGAHRGAPLQDYLDNFFFKIIFPDSTPG